MTGALWFAAADLIPRREARKVMLVLTDGAPDEWDSAAEVIGKARAAGIEPIGVGIQQDVSWLFPVAIRIDCHPMGGFNPQLQLEASSRPM